MKLILKWLCVLFMCTAYWYYITHIWVTHSGCDDRNLILHTWIMTMLCFFGIGISLAAVLRFLWPEQMKKIEDPLEFDQLNSV